MDRHGSQKKKILVVTVLAAAVVLLALTELLVGSSGMSVRSCVLALLGQGDTAAVRIMRYIRLPRLLAAVIAGAGLSAAGLVMQTVLGNPMASPATLGVSNAAVFGANLSIIALSGGFLSTGNNLTSYTAGADPFATSALAFVFAAGSVLVVLALCRLRDFSPNVVVLAGIALGSVWTAATTILQFYATDVGLSAAVIWSFGDLGRARAMATFCLSPPDSVCTFRSASAVRSMSASAASAAVRSAVPGCMPKRLTRPASTASYTRSAPNCSSWGT